MAQHPMWCELPERDRPCVDLDDGIVNWDHCRAVCPWCGKPALIEITRCRRRAFWFLSAVFCGFGLYLIFVACRGLWRVWFQGS